MKNWKKARDRLPDRILYYHAEDRIEEGTVYKTTSMGISFITIHPNDLIQLKQACPDSKFVGITDSPITTFWKENPHIRLTLPEKEDGNMT